MRLELDTASYFADLDALTAAEEKVLQSRLDEMISEVNVQD